MKMNFGDIVLLIIIFALSIASNAGNAFTMEKLISAGVGLLIAVVILTIVVIDYKPIWQLRAAEIAFVENRDADRYMAAIEHFKKKNKLLDRSYKGFMAEARLKLYQGNFTEALDALLYCDRKDMDKGVRNSFCVLRCKVLMFMDQLTSTSSDYAYITSHLPELKLEDRYGFALIQGYLAVRNGKLNKARKILDKLKDLDLGHNINYLYWPNEVRWLNSLIVLKSYSQFNYNTQYNLHKGSGSPKYIMRSIERQQQSE